MNPLYSLNPKPKKISQTVTTLNPRNHPDNAKDDNKPSSNTITSFKESPTFYSNNFHVNKDYKKKYHMPSGCYYMPSDFENDALRSSLEYSFSTVRGQLKYSYKYTKDSYSDSILNALKEMPDIHEKSLNDTEDSTCAYGLILTESPSMPGIPIAYRLNEVRKINPYKLNLSRKKLAICPIIKGEENLRLLNLRHNTIHKIQNLSDFTKLIFLDLYDNCIESISGLANLKCLHVLMLGKNRIRIISNLEDLTSLDILDLHGNLISEIGNISHLKKLRVLNLGSNHITVVKNLNGLVTLAELNLCRNRINTVLDLDLLPSLQQLFLSFNDIKSFNSISCLQKCVSLTELAINGNLLPIGYQQDVFQSIPSLKYLDWTSNTEQRKKPIKNAQNEWIRVVKEKDKIFFRKLDEGQCSVCHLAELDKNVLNLYGLGSLNAIEKNWEGDELSIVSISFNYISFDEIRPFLSKINAKFPSLNSLMFDWTNINTFNDINAFSKIHKLDHLNIFEKGNSVTNLSSWRDFTIFRLAHLKLKSLNNKQIAEIDVKHAYETFGSLAKTSFQNLCHSWRNNPDEDSFLVFHEFKEKNPEISLRKSFSSKYIAEMMESSIMSNRKQQQLKDNLPHIIYSIVKNMSVEMFDLESYCENSLKSCSDEILKLT